MSTISHTHTPTGKVRLRGLGIELKGAPGTHNAITDVAGVSVGYCTLIHGEGALEVGHGPIRTGVTAILPRGREGIAHPVMAGVHSLNGNGELTGSHWVEESGFCETPITLTNTHSCGVTRDATIEWLYQQNSALAQAFALPIAGETYDGDLNDINGFHVHKSHTFDALNGATSGPIDMGSVGGGTGMLSYDFKAGSGSASRVVSMAAMHYTVGVFVQSNFGLREQFVVNGAPIGRYIRGQELRGDQRRGESGSIIAIVATDAPLLPHQLKRLARRVPLGMARTGCHGGNGSGDIFLAFSTANTLAERGVVQDVEMLRNEAMDPLFDATVQATEEAILDAIVTAETMVGRDGAVALGLDHGALLTHYHRFHSDADALA